ncbi:hypothetical protein [Candidatus Nitrosotenuis aquarius]|uniref:hypothetical protein n=1 Tax=Candidatus Nitrosotenuis aquarius TaxID=1846278 RepID=UPI000C1E8A2C|nr:hypothetical protein [Candidatus Nitrosotenuis aquarius]
MVNLDIRVFENYTIQDILGEMPQADQKLQEKLEKETNTLIQNLDTKSKSELQEILSQHLKAKQEMTKFSGAQAMDQSKIEMFHEFLSKYITAIESKIK